jgi:hypothetical protein
MTLTLENKQLNLFKLSLREFLFPSWILLNYKTFSTLFTKLLMITLVIEEEMSVLGSESKLC